MSKQRNEPIKVNKGVCRHNKSNGRGTINQDIAHADRPWSNLDNGILMLTRAKATPHFITLGLQGFESVRKSPPAVVAEVSAT